MVQKLFAIQEGKTKKKTPEQNTTSNISVGVCGKMCKNCSYSWKTIHLCFLLKFSWYQKEKKDVFMFFSPKYTFYEINLFVRTKQFVIPPKERCYHGLFLSVFALREKVLSQLSNFPTIVRFAETLSCCISERFAKRITHALWTHAFMSWTDTDERAY